jgi:protocatechuate 3,4-dioxygenase alpha subunit
MSRLTATPGQTIGPFYGFALPYPGDSELVPVGHPGSVQLTGLVLDGDDAPVPDALLEIWQADGAGQVVQRPGSLRRDGYTFTGWGRAATDNAGRYSFTTILPGATDEDRPPFIAMTVFARGLLNRLFTRVYLPGHPALDTDPLLAGLDDDARRGLVAERDGDRLTFDIRLQGDRGTTFLSYPGHDSAGPPEADRG